MSAPRLCWRTGKRIHKRHQEAEKVVAAAQQRLGPVAAQVPRAVYRCRHCRRWHTSSMTRAEYRALQQGQG